MAPSGGPLRRDGTTPPNPPATPYKGQESLLGVIPGPLGPSRLAVVAGFGEPLAAGLDLGFGGTAVRPRLGLHRLARLDRLVDLEEVLDLQPLELRHVVDVPQVLRPGIPGRHAQHLV